MLFIFIFGFQFGFLCSLAVGAVGTYSIFTKFTEYQNADDLAEVDKKLGALVAGPDLIVHVIVSFVCY